MQTFIESEFTFPRVRNCLDGDGVATFGQISECIGSVRSNIDPVTIVQADLIISDTGILVIPAPVDDQARFVGYRSVGRRYDIDGRGERVGVMTLIELSPPTMLPLNGTSVYV